MYIGLNYIDGDFLPHRPDFSAEGGLFPQSTSKETLEAIEACRKACNIWRRIGHARRLTIVKELWPEFDCCEHESALINEDFVYLTDFSGDNFKNKCTITKYLLAGYGIIFTPLRNRVDCQNFVKDWNNISPCPAVVNLLHGNSRM
jgi:hypothetical protein